MPDVAVIRVTVSLWVAYWSRPGSPLRLAVTPGQQAATVFYRVALSGRLTPVRVAGVSVRLVALSRCPWGRVLVAVCRPVALRLLTRRGGPSRSGCRGLKAQIGYPFPLSLLLPFSLSLRRPLPPLFSPLCVSGEEEGRAWCRGVVDLAWSEEEVANRREGPHWGSFFVKVTEGDTFMAVFWQRCQEGSVRASRLSGLSCAISQQFGVVLVVLPRLFAQCLALEGLSRSESAFLAQTRKSLVSLPLSALIPEPRSGVRCEAAAWPGCGVACVVCSVAALSRPCAGAEAGARLESRACGLRVPLLAASGGGLVAVVVTVFSSRRFQVFLVARACTVVIARLCLVSVGIVGLALGRPMLLVVPASVFSRFRGPVLGCQPVMAPACVASLPGGVFGVRGGVLSTASALCPTPLVSAGVVVPAALTGEGLVIPTVPCLRGSPPYFLQLGARRHGSSVSDGLRRRLWWRVVFNSSESECSELLYPSELRVVFCKSSGATLGVPGEGSERSGRYSGVRLLCKSCALAVGGLQLLLAACVASVVARCVRVVLAQLAVDSLAVVFSYGGHLQASPGAVLLVVFGAFEHVCVAKAERACVCEVLLEFFSVGSGGSEVSPGLC
ncbi:hypothetical protein Taro_003907 [Colocasia esculenta]|uniref:Uncharacterized protein n=1 Tax=Colocasia esculenta TaxID=4460 RepID=A0A843TN38_COLES|nr:hypothetical protein [Colocasia esculenta]